jgi:2-desacetyl-2-hydroxyethyl bacteriochlorophyllide A dehydrogenase
MVRNTRTLISAGTELSMFTRTHRGFADKESDYAKYPFYPGYSAVGTVVRAPAEPGTSGIREGDTVAYKGKHSTFSVSGELTQCIRIPPGSGADLERFTFTTLLTTALTARHLAPIRPGENVVVVGMGIVGNLTAQLYRMGGAGVVAGADLSAKRLEVAAKSGAIDLAFDLRKMPLSEWVPELGPYGAELVIDAVGASASIGACITCVARRGRVVLLGSPREKMEIDPYPDIHSKGVTIIGAHTGTVDAGARERDRALVVRYLAEERIRVRDLVTHHLTLDDAQAAYEGLRDRPDEYIGVIFRYD